MKQTEYEKTKKTKEKEGRLLDTEGREVWAYTYNSISGVS